MTYSPSHRVQVAAIALDITLVTLALMSILVPLLGIALCVYSLITLHAWPIFVQTRVGRAGRLIKIWKIRTCHPVRNSIPSDLWHTPHPSLQRLRDTGLDELPQVLQALFPWLGIRLVGTRPVVPEEATEDPYVRGLHAGVTGEMALCRHGKGRQHAGSGHYARYMVKHMQQLRVFIPYYFSLLWRTTKIIWHYKPDRHQSRKEYLTL